LNDVVENLGVSEESNMNPNIDIDQEIEEYPELKASLKRYVDHPNMGKFSANELKEKRIAKRK